ncbi:MAG: hypothetical protein EB023_04330 [Flavobacteriia bacterium]|nr:hypothetical protein [Flavobacteriia bacterium]
MKLPFSLLQKDDRSGKAFRMLASSYLAIGAQIFSTLMIFPMILNFSDVSTLGVWILITQVGLYISILDAGVTSASIRLFVGPLSRQEPILVKNLFRAAFALCAVQSFACFASALAARPLSILLGLNGLEASIFEPLFAAQMVLSGISFLFRPFASVLLAAQRFGVTNIANSVGILLAIPLSFWGLSQGKGLWAVFAGQCLSQFLALIFGAGYAYRRNLVPVGWLSLSNSLGQDTKHLCREAFNFLTASLFNTGSGIMTSIALARFCGPEGVAIYNAGTKLASLSLMLLQKFQDIVLIGFAELFELGERKVLERRFLQGLSILVVFWTFASVGICGVNQFFLKFWMANKIPWFHDLNWVICGWLGAVLFSKYLSCFFTVVFYRRGIRVVPIFDFVTLAFLFLGISFWPSLRNFCFVVALAPWFSMLCFTIPHLKSFFSASSFWLINSLLFAIPLVLFFLQFFYV